MRKIILFSLVCVANTVFGMEDFDDEGLRAFGLTRLTPAESRLLTISAFPTRTSAQRESEQKQGEKSLLGQSGLSHEEEVRGHVVDIAQDLELEQFDDQDDQPAQVQAILNSLPADMQTEVRDRMSAISVVLAHNGRVVRSPGAETKEVALLAHVMGEQLKVQMERNQLMTAASHNSSQLAKLAVFLSGCVLITNIVNVWLSHTGKN